MNRAASARPSIFSSTSNSVSPSGLALTLIWMLIFGGCCPCPGGWVSERGAFGFSKERSLTYWASTLSDGPASLSAVAPPSFGGPPFVIDMDHLRHHAGRPGTSGGVANTRGRGPQEPRISQSLRDDGWCG